MAIYRGLNVEKALNDVDDPAAALRNLGVDKRDLTLIAGLTASGNDVTKEELHTVAGLVDDQKKVLYGLGTSATAMGGELDALTDIKQPLIYNYRLNNQLLSGAIKYKYYDFASGTSKTADISTSRVSSWSSISATGISYGGQLEVIGNTVTFKTLATTVAPIPKAFRAEVATHKISLKVDGVEREFLAMKGIPIVFSSFFRNADLGAAVTLLTDTLGNVPFTWRITNEDNGRTYINSSTAGSESSPAVYTFRDTASKPRKIEFFYNPDNILTLNLRSIKLSDWTDVQLPALKRLNIGDNDFYQLPSFRSESDVSTKTSLPFLGLAPTLERITISSNNMSRARAADGTTVITANEQLNTLPTTLKQLEMNGVFSDSTTIDLRDYINLEDFNMNSYYDRTQQRRMTGGTVTPRVSEQNISAYRVYNQPYSQLSRGVMLSTRLTYLYFPWCGVTGGESATYDTGGLPEDITIASEVITDFLSYGNAHNVVDMRDKEALVTYVQQSAGITGRLVAANPDKRTFVGKFDNCIKLSTLSFIYSTGIIGNVSDGLQNLPSLTSFDGRFTSISGGFSNDSFNGTNKLRTLLLAGSQHSEVDFFGTSPEGGGQVFRNTPELRTLYVYSRKQIRGTMPDMSTLRYLTTVYINNTGLSGFLPSFSGLEFLTYIRMDYTRDGVDQGFSGTVPQYTLPRLNYLYLTFNRLSGSVPKFDCPFLYQIYLNSNLLDGNVPDLSGCPRLQRVYLNNNLISGYVAGSLSKNTLATVIDISNNKLTSASGPLIISDLLDNWVANPRSGVTVNLLGNTFLTEKSTREDGTEGENSTSNKLDTLRSKGWTILMNAT